ncbi:cyclin-like protein [Schizophyllum amplum]|uniref:B-related factor 1 n=1 Tax=Schizophyllum amplum TaxID=97359 RepID=A0A550CQC3_9AGAR|nr:cyclin-like protein [Auriculariopsis ampla]
MAICTECGGTTIDSDAAAGNSFCTQCGTVVEESTIVNEVMFGETSTGAAMVQGSFVGQGATRARLGGPYGNRGNVESREQTLANAERNIAQIAIALHLSEVVRFAALRLYTLAVEHKFTKGRKSMNVAAVCLYVACRQKETRQYMLIDFSDILEVNVFELGHIYLQLVQTLNLRLPLVDPSHYISRFAALLEFGDETHRVANDAVRLVQRFDRDWMTRGRRPAGICGAALLLAARMNNFRRSIEEIVQVVKIADVTLKKRLDEFKNTPSGALTLADFRNVWLDEEVDPPAYTKGRAKEEAARLEAEQAEADAEGEEDVEAAKERGKEKDKRKGKRKREESDVDGEGEEVEQPAFDPDLLDKGIFAIEAEEEPPIDPLLAAPAAALDSAPSNPVEEAATTALAEEVSSFLHSDKGEKLNEALDANEEERLANITVCDELLGLDEEELDRFLLSDDEIKIKERVWVELNRDYLEALAAKGDETEKPSKSRKKRKGNKPRDASNATGATAAESARHLVKKTAKFSKRINYEAFDNLFLPYEGKPLDEKDDGELYTFDDKTDDQANLVVISDNPASRPSQPPQLPEGEADADGEFEDLSDKEDAQDVDAGWEEAYQQEV